LVPRALSLLVALVVASALLFAGESSSAGAGPSGEGGPRDAVVVAVIDGGITPYHWDYLASTMPQHIDRDSANDLPLDQAPHTWLPGFPNPAGEFKSYRALDLTLDEKNKNTLIASLDARDAQKWSSVKVSTPKKLHYYWMPNTKVIGAITFDESRIHGQPNNHGVGTTSSSVGNLHGTCPECLLLFIEYADAESGEAAIEWAMRQPWIDVISNSYGFSLAYRDRLYSGSNTKLQRAASTRGQTIFFSAGNGQDGAFVVPNTTIFSSQEGPDWIVTVGAVSPGRENPYEPIESQFADHASYSGHGKPADVAGVGDAYPTAYTSDTVGGTGTSGFGGTSNATPQVAGMYARALYLARTGMRGPSRMQDGGVIAVGDYDCASKRRDCELGDGKLTASELRTRLLHGALHTPAGMTPAGYGQLPPIGEEEFLNEGHGSYFGRELGTKAYLKEFDRILAPLQGRAKPMPRPDGELEWMVVDSFCRQHLWGAWKGGYYLDGKTELPGADASHPIRTWIEFMCPTWEAPP